MVTVPPPFDKLFHRKESPASLWPPSYTDAQFDVLVANIKDWQITHGSLLKFVQTDNESSVQSYPVGATLFPTLFPQELFDHALSLQKIYNKLYVAIAEDESWLMETLKDLLAVDPLASALWSVHEAVKRMGSVQDQTLGIFRSDYMLHVAESSAKEGPVLRQVELNTISCAGGVHGNKISDMHRHLHQTGVYETMKDNKQIRAPLLQIAQPINRTLETIANGLQAAYSAYVLTQRYKVCILMVVQPHNFNIADERPIEYALWEKGVPTFRIEWGSDILNHTSQSENRALLYHPPHREHPMEVGVVYYRAGFEAKEYSTNGSNGVGIRLRLESSRAIQCPSILSHLTTFKKVQQALALPNVLERFLEPREVALIRDTFAPMYPLDQSSLGHQGRSLALGPKTAQHHVLKPSLEGGGHNVYGRDIPQYLRKQVASEQWPTYILQENITPPELKNYLMSARGLYEGPVISELGVFGICLWTRRSREGTSVNKGDITTELEPCWSFKTKSAEVDEMSVVKGYGCFDSPALVDMQTFLSCQRSS